jgi:hypothetical protein
MVGISIKTEAPDQCHSPAASHKRYLAAAMPEQLDSW